MGDLSWNQTRTRSVGAYNGPSVGPCALASRVSRENGPRPARLAGRGVEKFDGACGATPQPAPRSGRPARGRGDVAGGLRDLRGLGSSRRLWRLRPTPRSAAAVGSAPSSAAPLGPGDLHAGLGVVLGPGLLGPGVVGSDVVALVVVGVLAEVLLVLGGDDAALGGLLDRQADAAALEVEVDDLDPQLLARRDHLLGQVDVVGRHLRDVDQALDAVAHLDERAERHELGDPAVDQLADPVAGGELLPRVLLGGLEREADALAVEVDLEHLHRDLVADRHDRTGVVDVLPGQLGHVHEAVHAAEVDEGAEVDDARHDALADLARLEVARGTPRAAPSASPRATPGGTARRCCGSCRAR